MNCTSRAVVDPTNNKNVKLTVVNKGLTTSLTYNADVEAKTTAGNQTKSVVFTLNGSTPKVVDVLFDHPFVGIIGLDYDAGSGGTGPKAHEHPAGHCCCCTLVELLVKGTGGSLMAAATRRRPPARSKKASRKR